jgi:copper(I)-binding protein
VISSGHQAAVLRRLFVLVIAALIPALAGCEAGNNAPTLEFHPTSDGAGTVHDDISIRDVFVLGAPLGAKLIKGQSAGLFFALVNNGAPDKLLSVAAPGSATSVTLPGGVVTLASQQAVFLTGPAPKVILNDLTRALTGGSSIKVVMSFENAGTVTLEVPVMPRAQYYSTFSPAPSPTPTPTPTVRKGKHASASPSPSPSES